MLSITAALLISGCLGIFFAGSSRTVGIVSFGLLAFLFPLVVLLVVIPLALVAGIFFFITRGSK